MRRKTYHVPDISHPPMEQHFTIREAAGRVGKSESTLKRLVNALKDHADSPDRVHILPTPEQWREYTKSGQPFQWKISETLLRQRFPDAFEQSAGEQGSGATHEPSDPKPDRIIAVLERSIAKLEEQLDRKDEQLSRKDEQIKTLTERVGESHVLIRDLHQQLALAAPKSTPADGPVEAETVGTTAAATGTKEKGSATPRSSGKKTKKPAPARTKASWFSFARF